MKTINLSKSTAASQTSKVLTDTYRLLAMTLGFSALTATIAVFAGVGPILSLVLMLVAFALLFVVNKKADTSSGLYWVFLFTGVMGASLGNTLSHYLGMSNGPELIMQSLGATAVVFLSLSAYAVKAKKDFSFMGGFLTAGLIAIIIAMVANIFFQIPLMSLVISCIAVLIMSGFILYDTSRIINEGETNYIRATVSLYLNIFNLFVHLLNILGILNDD